VLAGILNHNEIGADWIFKGGTCLKKCYFETYRFSEDLDFTLTESSRFNQDFLIQCFEDISEWIYDASGIEIPKNLIRFDVYKNNRGGMSAQGRIGYSGPLQPRGDLPRIKLDLTFDEILVLDPAIREVHHPYSDCPDDGIQSKCYCFEEVFAEKTRALAERERPRDLYDVVHLYRHDELTSNQSIILSTLAKKCEFKEMSVPTMDTFRNRPERGELETEWKNMLAHQLPALPSFEQFWAELPEVMEWLHGVIEKTEKETIAFGREAIDETWHPPSMAQAWHTEIPLEKIRFAAANRLCVKLYYNNEYRLIEPYSLRKTRAGYILLCSLRHDSGENRNYRIDRIQGAEVTNETFVPKYAIELTPSGPMSTPRLTRTSSGPSYSKSAGLGRKTSSIGLTYVVECSYCGKQFNRKKINTRMNPHKDKNGYPCPGRNGYLVDTKY